MAARRVGRARRRDRSRCRAALRGDSARLTRAVAHRAGNPRQANAAREAGSVSPAEERTSAAGETATASSRFTLRPPRPALPYVEFASNPRAGILFDVDTGEVLWERHPDRKLPIASLTKMLTALIIVERHRPGEMVEITPQAVAFEGSGVGVLPEGEEVRLEALLQGLLLVSGNDAAIALAQHDAGMLDFVDRMNRWRRRLGLRCSHFTSPHGLQDGQLLVSARPRDARARRSRRAACGAHRRRRP